MKKTWILVADSARARILLAETAKGSLRELEDFSHPEGRLHETEMTTDLPGRSFDRAGQGRHAMEQPTPPDEQEQVRFAKRLAKRLEQGRENEAYRQLILVAAPAFLGQLRKHLSPEVAKLVSYELDKDLARMSAAEIREHLPEYLPSLPA